MKQNRLATIFGASKVFLPVIHVSSRINPQEQVDLAFRTGAHGVWLICHEHGDNTRQLLETYRKVRGNTLRWIGLNFLGESDPVSIIQEELVQEDYPGGLWIDRGIEEKGPSFNDTELRRFYQRYQSLCPKGILFRGVAFKGQQTTFPSGVPAAVQAAKTGMDVITTSGPGTGHAPDVAKIAEIHNVANGTPVAIASGMTPENVDLFLPHIDAVLVSTGVSKPNTDEFDPEKLTAFARAIGLEP